ISALRCRNRQIPKFSPSRRNPQCEHRAFSYFALDEHIAAMSCRDFLHKREPKSEPALLARLLVSTAIKLLEDLPRFVRWNSESLIPNLKPDRAISIRDADRYRRP